MSTLERPRVQLLDADLDAVTEADCVDQVMSSLREGRGGNIITMNLDHLRRHCRDSAYVACARRASLVTADGMPLVWASRLQRTPLPERVTGSSLIWTLSAAAAREGRSVLLMGGAPGSAVKAAAALRNRFPGLKARGVHGGRVDLEGGGDALSAFGLAIGADTPDIVYVGLGSPKQEMVIEHLRAQFPHCWWVGVGIAFSFVAGDVARAPLWLQRLGLEWLHRLVQEPRRLARRYLVEDLPFATRLFASAWRTRSATRAHRHRA